MNIKTSIKASDAGLSFLKKIELNVNRIHNKDEFVKIPYADGLDYLANYFKLNNVSYIELINMICKTMEKNV